jgi:hypothetical protein
VTGKTLLDLNDSSYAHGGRQVKIITITITDTKTFQPADQFVIRSIVGVVLLNCGSKDNLPLLNLPEKHRLVTNLRQRMTFRYEQ